MEVKSKVESFHFVWRNILLPVNLTDQLLWLAEAPMLTILDSTALP